MTQVHHVQRSRTPKNRVAGRPLPLRLSPGERLAIEEMAKAECRPASNMVRVVFLRGFDAIKSEKMNEQEI
ncbi:MAG: hypothetical protein EKD82_04510 [Candidatus Symbiopectobacterium sp. PLON1]|nr:hypothetical protein [Candidatus Symbiopectobacterium sp. PLON1]